MLPLTLVASTTAGVADTDIAATRASTVIDVVVVDHTLDAWRAALDAIDAAWVAFVPAGATIDDEALAYVGPWMRRPDAPAALYTDEHVRVGDDPEPTEVLKPGWSPRLALEGHYAGGLLLCRVDAVRAVGGLTAEDVATFGHDLLLRLSEHGDVQHIPATAITQPLRHSWPLASAAAAERALARRGLTGHVIAGETWQHVRLDGLQPGVSIIIPTRDRVDLLRTCIDSITGLTDYPEFEIVVIDNDSAEPETHDYFASIPHQVVPSPGEFNFSDLMNAGAAAAKHPLLLLLNNDCLVEDGAWLSEMVSELVDPTVTAVGCLLRGLDGEPQHEGVCLGLRGAQALNIEFHGYCGFDKPTRDVIGVTAACVLVRADAYKAIGGFDHELRVGFGDVDFCLRLVEAGGRIVYTPHAALRHIGMASRREDPHREDDALFRSRWPLHRSRARDRFVNPRIEVFEPLWVTSVESVLPRVRAGVDA